MSKSAEYQCRPVCVPVPAWVVPPWAWGPPCRVSGARAAPSPWPAGAPSPPAQPPAPAPQTDPEYCRLNICFFQKLKILCKRVVPSIRHIWLQGMALLRLWVLPLKLKWFNQLSIIMVFHLNVTSNLISLCLFQKMTTTEETSTFQNIDWGEIQQDHKLTCSCSCISRSLASIASICLFASRSLLFASTRSRLLLGDPRPGLLSSPDSPLTRATASTHGWELLTWLSLHGSDFHLSHDVCALKKEVKIIIIFIPKIDICFTKICFKHLFINQKTILFTTLT